MAPLAERRRLASICNLVVARAQRFSSRVGEAEQPMESMNAWEGHEEEQCKSLVSIVCMCPSCERGLANTLAERWASRLPERLVKAMRDADTCDRCSATFLLDCVLIHSVRSYDLISVSRILADVVDLGAAPSAGVMSTIAFLIGQQLPSGAIGAYFISKSNEQSYLATAVTSVVACALEVAEDYLRSNVVIVYGRET